MRSEYFLSLLISTSTPSPFWIILSGVYEPVGRLFLVLVALRQSFLLLGRCSTFAASALLCRAKVFIGIHETLLLVSPAAWHPAALSTRLATTRVSIRVLLLD